MKKIFRAATLALVAFLGSSFAANAQGTAGNSPSSAIIVDGQPHTVLAHANVWFVFDYDASNLATVTIQLVNGTTSGLRFAVWTSDAIADISRNQPIAHGAAFSIACPETSTQLSGCQTPNLIWSGVFWTSQTIYVQVINDTNASANATLTVSGDSVSVASPPAPNPGNAPTGSAIPNQDDPGRAAYMDNLPHLLAAGAATWYRFDYDATDRPVRTVKLLYGNGSGVKFDVYTPDRLGNWWENKPVGRGTVYMIDCQTGEDSETGECPSPDLKWMGKFIMSWSVYVRVANGNGFPATFTLTLK